MKIVNSKVVYELEFCIMCNDGIRKTYNYCDAPHSRKTCNICKGRGKNDRRLVSETYSSCPYCKGTGKVMESKFSYVGKLIVKELIDNYLVFHFRDRIKQNINTDELFIMDCYSRQNSFAGCTDYLNHIEDSPEQLLALIKKDALLSYSMQALNYFREDGSIKKDIIYYGYNEGYRADWVDNPTVLTIHNEDKR